MHFAALVFFASVLGSLHCAGMCGPLVAFAVADGQSRSWWSQLRLQLAYHGGRMVSYALVGAAAGILGAAINVGASRLGLHRAAALLAGGLMVAVGIAALLRALGMRGLEGRLPGSLQKVVLAGQRLAMTFAPFPRALAIGLLTAILPCGWLYYFALMAAGTGSAGMGAVVMVAFWAGTVPILAAVGLGSQSLAAVLGARRPLIAAVLIVLLGLVTIVERTFAPLPMCEASQVEALMQASAKGDPRLPDAPPPCCSHHGK